MISDSAESQNGVGMEESHESGTGQNLAEKQPFSGGNGQFDLILFLLIISLSVSGLVMLYSASFVSANRQTGDGAYFFTRQFSIFLLGLGVMALVANIDYRKYQKYCPQIYFGTLAILSLTFVPGIGVKINGALRWISIGGMQFQPSELAKLAAVIFCADFLTRRARSRDPFRAVFLPLMIIVGIMAGTIVLQRDLSTGAVIITMGFVMCFLAGLSLRTLFLAGGAGSLMLVFLILIEDYRLRRIIAFLNPWSDRRNAGYHIIQSLIAVGSGGFSGKGLGMSVSKYNYLPEEFTDFIFAVICEETGFIGSVFFIALFIAIFLRGMRVALRCGNRFGTLLAGGITSLITLQAGINMGVVLSILPTTGLPLPFVSYGRSSMLVSCIMIGILLNISKDASAVENGEQDKPNMPGLDLLRRIPAIRKARSNMDLSAVVPVRNEN
ncbi:MAG: putative lipid II flippase FtsW [Candidatus Wallbacteria bacterium HGW-Wallbacteria-1]|jgi:cell division protein FtsW|uniref:Probable peptidoglycan glycosyltransferase FtsW n=1 Tax=Candidatus Wallbacteria bacterium HGW-Wallbacteria-1 TaxID=2013854 RepID=A0A2N1PQJ5_9BACT|nr:MAG: putative lipid II flippase FtsW [Candidatus Wallbacteria bacterium HGW-Wallbacteria-1]